MPICQHCHNKWTYKQALKRSFTLEGGMECPYCKEMQYYPARFKSLTSLYTFLPIALLFIGNLIFGTSYLFLIALLGLLPVFIGIFPFVMKLTNEEEHLF